MNKNPILYIYNIGMAAELKKEIKANLRTFSELKKKYGIENMYRSSAEKYFSTKSRKTIQGMPTQRYTKRPQEYESEENTEDILEPIWYSTSIHASRVYCRKLRQANNLLGQCSTYKYTPYDNSLVKNKKLYFLDLTGVLAKDYNITRNVYHLNNKLTKYIYDLIFQKYSENILDDGDNYGKYMPIDNKIEQVYSIDEIKKAYGYSDGLRSSDMSIDRFFTLELFHLIDELQIENELDCEILGYYHDNIVDEDNDGSFLPAEFSLSYKNSINKNYMSFDGLINQTTPIVGEKRKNIGGLTKKKRTYKNKTRRRVKKLKQKPL